MATTVPPLPLAVTLRPPRKAQCRNFVGKPPAPVSSVRSAVSPSADMKDVVRAYSWNGTERTGSGRWMLTSRLSLASTGNAAGSLETLSPGSITVRLLPPKVRVSGTARAAPPLAWRAMLLKVLTRSTSRP